MLIISPTALFGTAALVHALWRQPFWRQVYGYKDTEVVAHTEYSLRLIQYIHACEMLKQLLLVLDVSLLVYYFAKSSSLF